MLMRPAYLTIHKDSKSVMRHSSGDKLTGLVPPSVFSLAPWVGQCIHGTLMSIFPIKGQKTLWRQS